MGSLGLLFLVLSMVQILQAPTEQLAHDAFELTTTLMEPLLENSLPPIQKNSQPAVKIQKDLQAPTPSIVPAQETTRELQEKEVARTPIAPTPQQQTLPTANPISLEVPKVAPQAPRNISLENSYIASIRALLNANKRYPTGREASLQRPAGQVKIGFVLSRNGSLIEAAVEESSQSNILDSAGLATVRRTTYAAWPDGSWPSESQHKFSVSLDFVPLN